MSSLKVKTDQLYKLLQQATCPSFQPVLPTPALIIGLGTSGCQVLVNTYRLRSVKAGSHNGVRFIGADVDKDPRNDTLAEQRDIGFLPMGHAGAGSNITNGLRIAREYYDKLKDLFAKSMVSHMEGPDHGFNLSPSKLQSAYVVGGSGGGTSGGSTDLVVTALHDAKRSVGLSKLEVYPWTIGSQMPVLDVTRSVSTEAKDRIAANVSDNLEARYRQMNSKRMITEQPPIGDAFAIESSTRVWGNTEFDNCNSDHRVHTNSDLFDIMAACLEAQVFTVAGKVNKARRIDDIILSITGQMFASSGSPT